MAKMFFFNRLQFIVDPGTATIAGSAISAGGSIISGPLTAYMQHKYAQEDRADNFKYNEEAARLADLRERAQWRDMYSMEAQLRQIRENGLSPSLMMSGGVPGTQGAAGHQGSGAAGLSTGPLSPLLDMSSFANLGPALAQAKNQEAQAEYYHELAKGERGETAKSIAQIKQMLADAGLKDAQTAYTHATEELKHIEVRFANDTYDYKVSEAYSNSNYAAEQYRKAVFEVVSAEMSARFLEKTLDERVDMVHEQLLNVKADTALKWAQKQLAESNIQLNAAQITQLRALANWYHDDIEVRKALAEIEGLREKDYAAYVQNMKDFQDKQIKYWTDKLGFEREKFSTEKWQKWVDIVGTLYLQGSSQFLDSLLKLIPMIK